MVELSFLFITVILLFSTAAGIMLISKRREPLTPGVVAASFLINMLVWLAALHLFLA